MTADTLVSILLGVAVGVALTTGIALLLITRKRR
jgi:hypothetical protein